jgi:hypothetical protein
MGQAGGVEVRVWSSQDQADASQMELARGKDRNRVEVLSREPTIRWKQIEMIGKLREFGGGDSVGFSNHMP